MLGRQIGELRLSGVVGLDCEPLRAVVIGLSVQAGEEARRAIINAGGAVLLTKEAAVDELYRTIREVLDGQMTNGKGVAEVR